MIYERKVRQLHGKSNNHDINVATVEKSNIIRNQRILCNHMLLSIIKRLLHECSGNMNIYSPEKTNFSRAKPSGNIIFLEGINLYTCISLTIM